LRFERARSERLLFARRVEGVGLFGFRMLQKYGVASSYHYTVDLVSEI
jgi:hypothetical protein